MEANAMDPGERLKRIFSRNRKHVDISKEALARLAGVDVSVVSWAETGDGPKPSKADLKKVIDRFPLDAKFITEVHQMIDKVCQHKVGRSRSLPPHVDRYFPRSRPSTSQ